MADQDTILGTTGKDALPFEYQAAQQGITRKRLLAQAMLQRGMAAPRQAQMFGRYASQPGIGEALTQALQTYMGLKGMSGADQDATDLTQRVTQDQEADRTKVMRLANGVPGRMTEQQGPVMPGETLPPIEQGAVAPDRKAAIVAAMASRFGGIQALGAQMQKERQGTLMEQAKMLGGADPVRGIQHMQQGDPDAPVGPLAPTNPSFGTDPAGNAYAVVGDNKGGKPTLSFAPKPLTVTNDIRMGNKINGDAAKYFNYGGEGFKQGLAAVTNLRNTEQLLASLEKNPTMGTGAEALQFLRKAAETLGVDASDKTPLTEMTAMQLGQRTFARLGGLGAQISDADRAFVEKSNGSISSNPEALRRILLLSARADMLEAQRVNTGAQDVAGRLPAGTSLPTHNMRFNPSQRNADDLERLFRGESFEVPVPAPRTAPVGRAAPVGRFRESK